jgi:hypothetical protein
MDLERTAQDKGNVLSGAEVGEPIPGEDALNTDNQVLPGGGNRLEKCPRCCFHIPMQKDLSSRAKRQKYMVRACQSMPQ